MLGRREVAFVVYGLPFERGEVGESAYADHEELIEVGLEDSCEVEAFKEGDGLVVGFIENAFVET